MPRNFEVVEESGTAGGPQPAAAQPQPQKAALQMLMVALKALSQRMVVAIADLFTLLTVGSVFWLAMTVEDPNQMQLIKLAMFSLFILIINWIVRRK
jgi:hypothetical protein